MRRKPPDQGYTHWAGPNGGRLPEPHRPARARHCQKTADRCRRFRQGKTALAPVAAMVRSFRREMVLIATSFDAAKLNCVPPPAQRRLRTVNHRPAKLT